jgi:hypothetical protein
MLLVFKRTIFKASLERIALQKSLSPFEKANFTAGLGCLLILMSVLSITKVWLFRLLAQPPGQMLRLPW